MQKGCRFIFCLCLIFIFYLPSSGLALQQSQVTWADGNPSFSKSYTENGVKSDGFVELISLQAQANEPDTFSLHLTGIDRIFASSQQPIFIPEDFNRLPDIDLYLVTDAFGRRVFVIRPQDGVEVAEFKGSPGTAEALERPVSARAFIENGARKVLITDQGSHRVLKFDYDTRILEWAYGTGSPGAAPGELSSPADATPVPDSTQVLICDSGNDRILLVNTSSGQIVQTWGQGLLNDPVDVEWAGEQILITDRGNHRVILLNRTTGEMTWQFGTGAAALTDSTLNAPSDAQFLPDTTVLIADAGNNRLLQVNLNGKIVWQFLGRLSTLKSAFRLADGRTLVISDNQLKRLGYSTETFVSEIHDLGKAVNYDSLRWQIDQPAGTQARFQIRSANSLGDLAGAPWLGPSGSNSYYVNTGQNINPAHDGHRFYQYRVELSTQNPLLTPILKQVTLDYHFFEVDRTGIFTSSVISDSAGLIITSWKKLEFNTALPTDPTVRDDIQLEVRILDGKTDALLQSFSASASVGENSFFLSAVEQLKTVQAIRLQAVFQTNNSAVSPILEDWSIRWENTTAATATISFTTADGNPTNYIRAFAASEIDQTPPGTIFLTLKDQNVARIQNTVQVQLQSRISGDREQVNLELRPTGEYILSPGLPAIIQDFVVPNDNLMELADRDTLLVRYVDPTTPADVAADSVIVLQFTTGNLSVENSRGESVQTVSIGDTLFLHLKGERDRDLSAARDTVWATLFDNVTDDVENVMLIEVDSTGSPVYNSGEFISPVGIPLRRQSTSADNDGFLQTLPGHQIGAQYVDNENLIVPVQVRADTMGPPTVTGSGAFDILVAPNPFIAAGGEGFGLRICAFTGDLVVEKVEIYNLAGDRIRTMRADELALDAGASIAAGTCSISRSWWNLKTAKGTAASSGTYWARFSGKFTDATGRASPVNFMRKFILVQ